MKPGNAVSLIEAAYRLDSSTEQWLERVAAAATATLDSKQGAMAFRYDASGGDWVHVDALALHGLPPEFARDFFSQPGMPAEVSAALAKAFTTVRFGSTRALFERLGISAAMGSILDRYGMNDLVGVNGLDPAGRGCGLAIAVPKVSNSPRTVSVWHRLAAHVAAGNRLRTKFETLTQGAFDPTKQAEAVLAPNGKIEHATGAAEPRQARDALREALVRIDAARAEPDDAGRSVDLWRGLVAGRWSLVEHFESDGRRYYLAHKNDPELKEDRALTLRERQVIGYAELGNSNKVTAYALGISSSTVSTLLARARRKIGMTP